MAFDRFLIAPLKTGLQTDERAWQIMDDAFTFLQNAYIFRGRLRKRFGSITSGSSINNSRLGVNITSTDGSGDLAYFSLPGAVLNVGAAFSVGNILFTVVAVPTVAGNTDLTLSTDTGPGGPAVGTIKLLSTPPNIYQFKITGGQTSIASLPVYFYPANPVMGITQYEINTINNHPSYAFDTQFAYVFNGSEWTRSGTAIWHGTNLNYFWSTNWQGSVSATGPSNTGTPVMFVTNFNAATGTGKPTASDDPIWYTADGSTWTPILGTVGSTSNFFFLPSYGGTPQDFQTGPFVQTCLMIIPFKNRLLLLNTIENDNSSGSGTGTATQYKNRCRFSFNGSPFARNAWYEPNTSDDDNDSGAVDNNNIGAGAGYIDAATEEAIVSAEFIKDRLIVYFERSTWEIVYTQNEVLPFVWQKINTELGSQSTFSTVAFDKDILTVGNTGVHACTGANVQRTDDKIPDEIFDYFQAKNSSPARTFGIRDYFTEMVYWSFVDTNADDVIQVFPTQVLVYNYRNGSWAINDDCFTAFGYVEQRADMTWASSAPLTWMQSDFTWNDNIVEANHREILAGTPEGYMLIIAPDIARNAPSMQITQVTIPSALYGAPYVDLEIINHNLYAQDAQGFSAIIALENLVGVAAPQVLYPIEVVYDANTVVINDQNNTMSYNTVADAYQGGGTAARVSNIQAKTKQWNPYDKNGSDVYLARIDFAVQAQTRDPQGNSAGITVDYFPSASEISMIAEGIATDTIMGNSVLETAPYDPTLYPFEQYQDRLWHQLYFQVSGECIQLSMYFSPIQLTQQIVVWSDFQLEAMLLHTCKTSNRMQ